MGQKVNPIGLRLGINRTWDSRWFASKGYAALLHEDLVLRKFLQKRLRQAGVSRIVIERPAKRARITIYTARPGVIIGKKGADIEKLRSMARIQNIGASGSMEAVLYISKKSTSALLPGLIIPLAGIVVAGVSLRKSRPPTPDLEEPCLRRAEASDGCL